MRVFGAYLRKKASKKYEAQNFAPLAKSTLEKRAEKGLKSLEHKLGSDVRKAQLRQERIKRTKGVVVTRGVENRLAALAEFQRSRAARSGVRRAGGLAGRIDLKPLTLKQLASLGGREFRAVARVVGGPILGRLSRSLVVETGEASVKLISRTHGHWSEVHNIGGTAGRSRMPKRETLKLDESDLVVFGRILKEHCLIGMDS